MPATNGPDRSVPEAPEVAPEMDTDAEREVRPSYAELMEALVDMVAQHAVYHHGDLFSHGGLSANEYAIDLLDHLGVIEQPDPTIRRYRWKSAALVELSASSELDWRPAVVTAHPLNSAVPPTPNDR